MKYDLKKNKLEIANRIKKQREACGFKNQLELTRALGLDDTSRPSVSKWESGKRLPKLDHLVEMCSLFDCEIGYLLCEYDLKKRDTVDINKVTGLSEDVIEWLQRIKDRQTKYIGNLSSDLINYILADIEFWNDLDEFLPIYIKYKREYEESNISVVQLDMIKYSLFSIFEKMINGLCNYLEENNPQPVPRINIGFLERTNMKITRKKRSDS